MTPQPCPKCGLAPVGAAAECPRCGLIFAKYKPDRLEAPSPLTPFPAKPHPARAWAGAVKIGVAVFCAVVAAVLVLSLLSRRPAATTPSPVIPEKSAERVFTFAERDPVTVGYTYYYVWGSWWSDRLSENKYLNRKPDAAFLFVKVSVQNEDSQARVIPPFKLVDRAGAVYDAYGGAWVVPGSIGVIENLNPKVKKEGFVVFDAPTGNDYCLLAAGGYYSKEKALIRLNPKTPGR